MLMPYGQCTEVHTDTTWLQKYKGLDIYAWYQMTSYPMFVWFHNTCTCNVKFAASWTVYMYIFLYAYMNSCMKMVCQYYMYSSVCMLIDFLFTCTCIINWKKLVVLSISISAILIRSIFFIVTIYVHVFLHSNKI